MKEQETKLSGDRKFTFFVSYSRQDAHIVKPIVEVLRVSGITIFRDEDSISPGTPWRSEITTAIENCTVILVFWCSHASRSKMVKNEYMRGIRLKKKVVPVLLDATPMASLLSEFQAIDLRHALVAHERLIETVEAEGEGHYYDDGWSGRTEERGKKESIEAAEDALKVAVAGYDLTKSLGILLQKQ